MDESLIERLEVSKSVKSALKHCEVEDDALSLLKDYEVQLDKEISELSSCSTEAQKLLDELHKYNDIKDVTQSIIGFLANLQGETVTKIHKEFDLPLDS